CLMLRVLQAANKCYTEDCVKAAMRRCRATSACTAALFRWTLLVVSGLQCAAKVGGCPQMRCNNGGTCLVGRNVSSPHVEAVGGSCICPAGFGGKLCEVTLRSCYEEPCKNGALCIPLDESADSSKEKQFLCRCRYGWKGTFCEEDVDECKEYAQYCGNGGTCVNSIGSAMCLCPMGFSGDNCERPLDRCSLEGFCKNGGICDEEFCSCQDGYSGDRCERVVPYWEDYKRAHCMEYPEFCALRFADGKCNEECNHQNCFYDGFDCIRNSIAKCSGVECGFDGGDCDTNSSRQSDKENSLALIINASPEIVLWKLRPLLASLARMLHSSVRISRDAANMSEIFVWSTSDGIGERIDIRNTSRYVYSGKNTDGVILFMDIDASGCLRRRHGSLGSRLFPCFTSASHAAVFLLSALSSETDGERKLLGLTIDEVYAKGDRIKHSAPSMDIFRLLVAIAVVLLVVLSVVALFGFNGILRRRKRQQTSSLRTWIVPRDDRTKNPAPNGGDGNRGDYFPHEYKAVEVRSDKRFKCGSTEEGENNVMDATAKQASPTETKGYFCDDSLFESCMVCTENKYEEDIEPELIKAVREGCLDKVGELVARGVDVNCEDADGNSALHHAILANNVHVLRILLASHKCNLYAVNALGQMPLTLTVSKPHVSQECARILLDAMNEENTAIQRATDDIALPQRDISLGNSTTPTSASTKIKKRPRPQCVSPFENGPLSRFVLCESDERSVIDLYGRSALHYAALNNRPQLLALFYSNGLKLDHRDNKGETALHLAAREGHYASVEMLLSLGANKEVTDQLGRTAYHMAAERNRVEIMELLLKSPKSSSRCTTLPDIKRKRRTKIRRPALTSNPPRERGCSRAMELQLPDMLKQRRDLSKNDQDAQSKNSLGILTRSSPSSYFEERPNASPAASLRVLTPQEEILQASHFDFEFLPPAVSEENNSQWCDEDFLDGVPCIMSESLISEQLFKNLEDITKDISAELSDTMLDG
uniref:EGF-like domain-containing protein n=1 Tax=Parascaris univalens TaxID=6257 RepID=A0A914ZZK3_PARUN